MKVSVLAIFCVVVAHSGIAIASEPAMKTTVCQLVAHPKLYRDHRVEVSGSVQGDIHLRLFDFRCPRSPVGLLLTNDLLDDPEAHRLWSAIYRDGGIGTIGKRIKGTFLGTFGTHEDQRRRGFLDLVSVRDLDIERIRADSPK